MSSSNPSRSPSNIGLATSDGSKYVDGATENFACPCSDDAGIVMVVDKAPALCFVIDTLDPEDDTSRELCCGVSDCQRSFGKDTVVGRIPVWSALLAASMSGILQFFRCPRRATPSLKRILPRPEHSMPFLMHLPHEGSLLSHMILRLEHWKHPVVPADQHEIVVDTCREHGIAFTYAGHALPFSFTAEGRASLRTTLPDFIRTMFPRRERAQRLKKLGAEWRC